MRTKDKMSRRDFMKKTIVWLTVWLILVVPFYWLSRYNYGLYHLAIEIMISMVGILIFGVSINARTFNRNNFFIHLGPGFMITSVIGIIHGFTYSEMNLVPGIDANLPTQLWIILSYLLAFSFLFTAIFYKKEVNYFLALSIFSITGTILSILSFLQLFPKCFITGIGLTPFKRISEYIIIFIYLLAIFIFIKTKNLPTDFLKQITLFICMLILSGVFFTLYFDVFGIMNFLGHYVKAGAFWVIYQALMLDLIEVPYKKIMYDSIHNSNTGLYNHKYFFTTIKEKSYNNPAIILLDIDGLKLINETLGYGKGDQLICVAGEIIKASLVGDYFAAHINGGEFAVIINNGNEEQLQLFIKGLEAKQLTYNKCHSELPLSITYGFSTRSNNCTDIMKLYQEAYDSMYAKKVLNIKSTHNTLVKTLMKTLETKDFTTKEHASRMVELATALGRKIGLSENRLNGIELFTEFHDIGKIGISDNVLLKPGQLNEEERLIIQRHSMLGYEIAISSADLAPISDFILKHHERWDGKGYPMGLAGEDIPVECRILAIVDAYDAIINDRPYRKGKSNEEALEEIKKCAGTQFDPELVEMFLEIISQFI